ncbi:MAG TPA: oligoendopeptidase F [Treponema sp.]|nr:oligoendopeptidase F [Treponema sp.]
MKQTTIPTRSDVPQEYRWNLDTLFVDNKSWDFSLEEFSKAGKTISAYRNSLATSPEQNQAIDCLEAYRTALQLSEKLGQYAFLHKSVDEGSSEAQDRVGRFMMSASAFEAETSWLVPAMLALPEETLTGWIANTTFSNFHTWLERLVRMKAHILSEKEEKVLALLTETLQTPHNSFSVLTNVDLEFGSIETSEGTQPLTQTTWSRFLENPDRNIREAAYKKFYASFESHQHTISSLYTGSVNQDVAEARIRGYDSARSMALFPDRVPETVYDNLVTTVRENLDPLHRYYALRKKVLKVQELRHYDVYVPLVPDVKRVTTYEQAVDLISEALAPLGTDYTDTLKKGLLGGWVDRYENKGKRSGAFSSGGYEGWPYILMNYKDDVLRDVFTLAHEGGHSMHSNYSAQNNPFMSYDYTIFEAEVASTFNEDLLFRHLIKTAPDDTMRAYLLSTRASDILATLYRQTMFAEYEHRAHALVEAGTPLTTELLRSEYRGLLETYFGTEMIFDKISDLEGLRIPHFYNAFYVYKYATGISASLALAERVVSGGTTEQNDYFTFLKSGGSRFPIDSLRIAGVDMESREPVQTACNAFAKIVDELESILS